MLSPTGILIGMAPSNTFKETSSVLQPAGQNPPSTYRGPLRPIARRRLLMTDPMLCGSDITGLRTYLQLSFIPLVATGTAKVKVHRAWMGVVPDPRVAFGLAT